MRSTRSATRPTSVSSLAARPGSGAVVAAASSDRRTRDRASCASATVCRVIPTSQAGSRALSGSNRDRPRQAATNTCWVTSSASARVPSERSAIVCTSADQRR
ncbi:Uncharacterised protein [Mycobacteroides abscessus]|nr:Uncharacterised protein [Mycobacteroides abscessus]